LGNESESKDSLLAVKPQNIDCGCFSLGQEAKAVLIVSGGPGKVLTNNEQINVFPTSFDKGEHTLEITLSGSGYEELIWDEIIIETGTQKLKVPVTVRWTNTTAVSTSLFESEEDVKPLQIEKQPISVENRTFNGQTCSLCGKNLSYNNNNGTWEQCKCSKPESDIKSKPRNIQSKSKPTGNWVLALIGTFGIAVGFIYGIVKLFAKTQNHLAYFSPALMSVIVLCVFVADYNKGGRQGSLLAIWILGFISVLAAVFIPQVRWVFIVFASIVATILLVRYINPMKRTR